MTFSINTNQSSMVALETLSATQSDLSKSENAVSTGKKVSTSADSPAAFGISSQIGGDISGQSAVNDGLSYASQIVSSTNSAANSIISVLQNVQNAVTSIGDNLGNATSLGQIDKELTGYMKSINTIARNATVKGINLLASGTTDGLGITANSMTFVTGLQGDSQTLDSYNTVLAAAIGTAANGVSAKPGTTLTDALGLTSGGTAGADPTSNSFLRTSNNDQTATVALGSATSPQVAVQNMIKTVQNAIAAMTNVTSDLGSSQKTIDSMSSYGQKTSDSLTAASGALTDADMSAESAKLTSLQTKQSLGIKSLSIANGQSQNILSLFQ